MLMANEPDLERLPFDAKEPRYLMLAREIVREIRSGSYPVGALLPAESELSARFAVSRFTVREAIRKLTEAGLLSRHQGVGTRVEAAESQARYVQYIGSIEDFWQYVADTRLHVLKRTKTRTPLANVDLPELGEDWPTVEGFRYRKTLANRICWTRIFINPSYAGIVADIGTATDPIYVMIEKRYNEKIVEVQQQISAVILSPEIANHVKAKAGTTGLQTLRRYIGSNNRVLEVTISIHPSDRFRYDQKIRLEYVRPRSAASSGG
jgi:DNA-binding GntR family transcriptional regulator